MPETVETLTFDDKGECSICHSHNTKVEKINWAERKLELDELVAKYKGKSDYDCIVPFSGGKDSTFTLLYLIKEYNLRPLVVRFDHSFFRPNLHQNTQRTLQKLGVDSLTFTPNWKMVRRLMLISLLEKGDFCWHCHTGIFAYPMRVALEKKIPLLFWGEASAEYTNYYSHEDKEKVDEERFDRFINLGISADDMYLRLGGVGDKREYLAYTYPKAKDLNKLRVQSVCLGSYIPWDIVKLKKTIVEELGWNPIEVEGCAPEYNFDKTECQVIGIRDYLKYVKRGYGRTNQLSSIDIRQGRKTRDEAVELVDKYEGKRPGTLGRFLKMIGLTEDEFIEVAKSHGVSPYEHDFANEKIGEKPADFDSWMEYEPMPRAEALKIFELWQKRKGK